MRRVIGRSLLVVLVPLLACESTQLSGPPDAGLPEDTGHSAIDATAGRDATPAMDAAPTMDATGEPDAVGMDAIEAMDATPGMDAVGDLDAVSGMDATPGTDAVACASDGGVTTSSLNLTSSSYNFIGIGPPSTVGLVTVTSTSGNLQLPVATNTGGSFSVTVPLFCGPQTVDIQFGDCGPLLEYAVTRTDCAQPDIQVTLSWDNLGLDFELHLIEAGGHINDNATDCTWTSCISGSPDWGLVGDSTDNPHKDVDNTGNYGPENIYLSRPANGPYTVMVEHWGNGSAMADGSVTITLRGGPQVTVPIIDLPAHWVRTIGTIDWTTHNVTTATTTIDCTANWSGGCRMTIP